MLGFFSRSGAPPDERVRAFLTGASLDENYSSAVISALCAMAVSPQMGGVLDKEGHLLIARDGNSQISAGIGAPQATEKRSFGDLAAAWHQGGERCLERLRGDYALCVWDAGSEQLHLVRDPLGFRPLYFVETATGLAFASRADAFASFGTRYCRPDYDALLVNHCLQEPREHSFFEGVQQLRPGELVTVTKNKLARRTWWRPSLVPHDIRSTEELLREYRPLLKAAVADAIQGAGPVLASHLSAGLDSGVVTSIAADLRLTSTRLIAFTGVPGAQRSYSFSNRLLDEGNLASQAARYMPSVEHRFISALGDPIGPLFTAADLYQQPLANPFNAGWFSRIQDESSEAGARTLLIGQLGNYSFSMSGDRRSKIRTIAQQVRQAVSPPGKDLRSGVFLRHRPNATSNGDPASTLAGAGRRLNVLSRLDPGTLLRGTRRHWGLDLRDPYADRRLVEFSLRIPEGLLCALGERGLARAIGAERLPASVLEEPRRGYQSADWVARLKAHTESASMLISRCWDYGDLRRVLDLPAMQRAIQRLERSQRITAADEWLYRTELPRTLALAAFVQSLQP